MVRGEAIDRIVAGQLFGEPNLLFRIVETRVHQIPLLPLAFTQGRMTFFLL